MSNDNIASAKGTAFNSQAVINSATPLVLAVCHALESEFDQLLGSSRQVKTVEEILTFMRTKSNHSRITPARYTEIMVEMYDGCSKELVDHSVARLPHFLPHFTGPDGLLDVNDLLGSVFMLYSRYGLSEKSQLLFSTFDDNDDGFVTKTEMNKCFKGFFQQFAGLLDGGARNPEAYGVVLGADYTPFLPGLARVFDLAKIPTMVDKAFAAADVDNDGKISKAEWIEWTNKDNAFTSEWGSIGGLLARSAPAKK
jgi:Ca2+-binding EF-hand superfamily protein